MSDSICTVSGLPIGGSNPLVIIGGPCTLESNALNEEVGGLLQSVCRDLGMGYIFKGSFDKANRSSIQSPRGPGLEAGLAELGRMGKLLGVPVTTDIHEPGQAAAAGDVVDLLQIPAFLCRQTDLLLAAATSGCAVNVKKGQFLSPGEMRHVINKLEEGGCSDVLLTERGTFFGYHRLVNDFTGLGDLMELGPPVCFDVTHSTQLPGADTSTTGGRPDRAPLLARAATAAGVDALFLECHPTPAKGFSDASTMLDFKTVRMLLEQVASIRGALQAARDCASSQG